MGASRPRVLSAIRLADAPLRNPIGRLARPVMINLFAAIEKEFADPAAAIRLANAARPGCFSDLGFIAMFAANVGQMVSDTVDIQAFRQNIWQARFDRQSSPARLTWLLPDDASNQLDASVEFSVASYVHLYRHSLPAGLRPKAISFRHQPRFDVSRYEDYLGCPVMFGVAETCIEFSAHQLALPSPQSNPRLQRELLAYYDQPMQWLAGGQKHAAFSFLYLASELNKSPLKLDRLAASFGLTERTLRRKLVHEGFPFRDLLDRVRRGMCDLYRLEGRRSMGEIAELLGYAELSAFSRAHSRWYGEPPTSRLKTSKGENGGRSKD
jgi:AraC-like DNA-binding protein